MKKILLATTMLAGTAGFAAAEVSVSGYAEIGIWSNTDGDVQFWQDVDVTFTMTGTTDGGLEFGASVDLDEADFVADGPDAEDGWNALDNSTKNNGATVWVSGAFGKLTMGDTDGALDWALADMDGGMTSIADDHTSQAAWFGDNSYDGFGDGQIARYENTFGDIGFAISAEQVGDGATGGETIFGIGVKYTANLGGTDVNLGLGYQDADSQGSAVGVSAGAVMAGGFGGKIGYVDYSDDIAAGRDKHLGLEVSYVSGPIGVAVNYGKVDYVGGADEDSWGAVANYDLGGGAKVMFGYGSNGDGLDNDQWSLGLGLSF